MKKLLSVTMAFVMIAAMFMSLPFAVQAEDVTIDEIRIDSSTTSVQAGILPSYIATTTTEHISIDAYGSNINWLQWPDGESDWIGFGSGEKIAKNDGKTRYALRLRVVTDTGYQLSNGTTKIIFNGIDVTSNEKNHIYAYSWGGYVYIDLGLATTATFFVTFDANGATGTMADVVKEDNSIYTLPSNEFTAPSGKQFKCWSVNGVEKNVGDTITITANTVVSAVWVDIPHIHTPVTLPAVAPTCSSTGLTEGSKCSVCGETIVEQETVAKTAHTPIIFPAVAPTCSSTGLTAGSKCAVCGETIVEQETLAKTAHTYKDVVTKATTSKNGKTESKCSVCGNVSKTTAIYAAKSVTLSKTAYTYTGKALKPTVTVKDSKGKVIDSKYYTVKYTNNKNVGKATVTITLKGNYSGTLKATFKINPKATTLSSVTANSKGFTAKWKKQSTQTTGYQIQYSTSKKFTSKTTKTVTVKDAKTLTKTISKLKASTKYYVRVRTYKTVSKTNYYSSWSAAKTVTTKK